MKILALLASTAVVAAAAAALPAQAQTYQPNAEAAANLRAYPDPGPNQQRFVIMLPEAAHEDNLKVQLMIGQTKTVDCNVHLLAGEMDEETVDGWGFTYFEVDELREGPSTLMMCPPGSERQSFVTLPEQTIVRYNSKLPLVVYAPLNAELRYRLWRAGDVLVAE